MRYNQVLLFLGFNFLSLYFVIKTKHKLGILHDVEQYCIKHISLKVVYLLLWNEKM